MSTLLRDLRISTRTLARQPGFTAVAVLTLALGVGANTAMFSVVNGVLLRPLVVEDADRVVALRQVDRTTGEREDVSVANFMDWQAASTSFTAMALAEPYGFDYMGPDGPVALDSWRVTRDFFEVLRLPAMLGRTFRPDDFTADRQVVVIGHDVWRERFGGDPGIAGTILPTESGPAEVVGVMPPGFEYPRGASVWTPVRYDPEAAGRTRAANYFQALARLGPGITPAAAEAELAAASARIAIANAGMGVELGAAVEPLHRHLVGGARPALLILLGAVGVLLLLASVNVANLVLARSVRRSGEVAVRSALGAGRGALIRESLAESLVLGLAGGTAGVLVAFWTQDIIIAFAPPGLPRIDQVGVDTTVLAFAAAASLLTTAVFGLLPALRHARQDPRGALRPAARGLTGSLRERLVRDGLVVLQVAMAMVLLTGAALVVRSFTSLLAVDRGYRTEGVLASTVQAWGYFPSGDDRATFVRAATDRLAGLPGVTAAGVTSSLPLADAIGNEHASIQLPDRPVSPAERPSARAAAVTPGFFDVLDIPLRRGRMFAPTDGDGTPVVLINERFARQHFAGEDPVGRRVEVGFSSALIPMEIVGVVGDARGRRLEDLPVPTVYVPHAQAPTGAITFVVRTAGDPTAWADAVQRTIWEFNERMPVENVTTLDALLRDALAERRFHLFLLAAFAGLGLVIAAVGVYGVLSYATRQRTREIGIRMALGARARDVVLGVAARGVVLVALGLCLGLAVTIPASRALRSILYGVQPTDLPTYLAALTILAAVGLGAAIAPAHAATRVDPSRVLNSE